MTKLSLFWGVATLFFIQSIHSQTIGTFISVQPTAQTEKFVLPSTHRFQVLAQTGDALTGGGMLNENPDFTCYVPIANSSTQGYISLNHETAPGGVTIFDVNYNATTKLWQTTSKQACTMVGFGGTAGDCSGGLTPWGTVLSGEEGILTTDFDLDGYNDVGWLVETDPVNRQCFRKIWAAGCMQHENAAVASNGQYLYEGTDNSTYGFLFKYVFTTTNDPTAGTLYVLKLTGTTGTWEVVANTTKAERNNAQATAAALGATNINRIEDVEIGPDGKIYVTSTALEKVYRFNDNGLSISNFETYMDAIDYPINYGSGTVNEPYAGFSQGNDNLAFDGDGNLWILQDGGRNHIWVVSPTHTPGGTNGVRLFATTPAGSEPTGITFTPDYKFMFLSIQHPYGSNAATQTDAANNSVVFNKGTTLIIARNENLGSTPLPLQSISLKAKTIDHSTVQLDWQIEATNMTGLVLEKSKDGQVFEPIFKTETANNKTPQYPTQFFDENPNRFGSTYYRLKVTTLEGDAYSRIVSAQLEKQGFTVFPNPFKDVLNIELSDKTDATKMTIKIFNSLGQLVYAENSTPMNRYALPLDFLQNGIYSLQIESKGQTLHQVVIKTRD